METPTTEARTETQGQIIGRLVDSQKEKKFQGNIVLNFKAGEVKVVNKNQSFLMEDIAKIIRSK